jgi:hypothetical protein
MLMGFILGWPEARHRIWGLEFIEIEAFLRS